MSRKEYKSPLNVRGDSLYCPLAFGLDTYWNCPYDCRYCYCRRLNRTWGQDQRVADPERVRQMLSRPGRSGPLAAAIRGRKTIRLGNRADPFPPEEFQLGATRGVLAVLKELDWSMKLETKSVAWREHTDLMDPGRCAITATVTCGLDRDYESFEPSDLPIPLVRLQALKDAAAEGFQVGVISEPFIPGWHTVDDWSELLTAVRDYGIYRVNMYHLHFNAFVAKRLATVPGLDIEAVWRGNEDEAWRPVLHEIIRRTEAAGVTLGCPDFVNSGGFIHDCNTCCGVDVPEPTTFNFICWKNLALDRGQSLPGDVENSWDGVGDLEQGRRAYQGELSDMYGWKDLGWEKQDDESWTPKDCPPAGFF